jgi:hypothetical protein
MACNRDSFTLYLVSEENPNSHRYDVENCIKMDKAKIFVAHLATSCSTPLCCGKLFENHCSTLILLYKLFVVCWDATDVSEEHVASIFRVEENSSK